MLLAKYPAHRKPQPQVLAGGIFGVEQGGFLLHQLVRKTRPVIGHGGRQDSMLQTKSKSYFPLRKTEGIGDQIFQNTVQQLPVKDGPALRHMEVTGKTHLGILKQDR